MWRGVSRHYLNYIMSSRGWFFTGLSYSESNRLTSHSVSRFCGLSRVSSTATWIHCPFPRRYSRPRTRLYYRQNENNFLPERSVAWRACVCVYVNTFSDDKWIPRSVYRPLISCSATHERKKGSTRRYLSGQPLALLPSRIPVLRQKDFIISANRLIWAVGVYEPVELSAEEQISD